MRIDFRHQPWKDVLEWFASTQSLSLVMDAEPPGVFDYSDPHQPKSAQEVMELLNTVLLARGYALVISDEMLLVVQIQRPKSGEAFEAPPAATAPSPSR